MDGDMAGGLSLEEDTVGLWTGVGLQAETMGEAPPGEGAAAGEANAHDGQWEVLPW